MGALTNLTEFFLLKIGFTIDRLFRLVSEYKKISAKQSSSF